MLHEPKEIAMRIHQKKYAKGGEVLSESEEDSTDLPEDELFLDDDESDLDGMDDLDLRDEGEKPELNVADERRATLQRLMASTRMKTSR